MYEKATDPDRVFTGVVQQIKTDKEDCFDSCEKCKARKDNGQIRVLNYDYKDAKGPTYARYQASKLWDGEEWYLQIDSHMKFEKGWDDTLLNEIARTNDPKAIVGGYPPTETQLKEITKNGFKKMISMCEPEFNADGLLGVKAAIIDSPPDGAPVKMPFSGAGLLCMPYKALFEVPYDPYLSFLFFGEEVLHCARLWTHGYNFYAPVQSFVSHHYSRNGKPKFWSDNKDYEQCRKKAVERAKYLLDLAPLDKVNEDFQTDITRYALGNERSLDEYWKYLSVDWKTKKAKKQCTYDAYK